MDKKIEEIAQKVKENIEKDISSYKLIDIINGNCIPLKDTLDLEAIGDQKLIDDLMNSEAYKYGYRIKGKQYVYDIRVLNEIIRNILLTGCRLLSINKEDDVTYMYLNVPIRSFLKYINDNGKEDNLESDKCARAIKKRILEISMDYYKEEIPFDKIKIIYKITDDEWTEDRYKKAKEAYHEIVEKDPFGLVTETKRN